MAKEKAQPKKADSNPSGERPNTEAERLTIKVPFIDDLTGKRYQPGDEYTGTDADRLAFLVSIKVL